MESEWVAFARHARLATTAPGTYCDVDLRQTSVITHPIQLSAGHGARQVVPLISSTIPQQRFSFVRRYNCMNVFPSEFERMRWTETEHKTL